MAKSNARVQLWVSEVAILALFWSAFGAFGQSSTGFAPPAPYLSSLEIEVLGEINFARQHPRQYASLLKELKKYYYGCEIHRPGEDILVTKEDSGAVDEAIRFLHQTEPLTPLFPSRGLSLGARDHARDIRANQIKGHTGSDGSRCWDRARRYGVWRRTIGENIACGPFSAREIVMALIVDDGVADRGHRNNIFQSDFRLAGVSCASHPRLGRICVMTFAGEYQEARPAGRTTRLSYLHIE